MYSVHYSTLYFALFSRQWAEHIYRNVNFSYESFQTFLRPILTFFSMSFPAFDLNKPVETTQEFLFCFLFFFLSHIRSRPFHSLTSTFHVAQKTRFFFFFSFFSREHGLFPWLGLILCEEMTCFLLSFRQHAQEIFPAPPFLSPTPLFSVRRGHWGSFRGSVLWTTSRQISFGLAEFRKNSADLARSDSVSPGGHVRSPLMLIMCCVFAFG